MGAFPCCNKVQQDQHFKNYCKQYSSQPYKKYLQSIFQMPKNIYQQRDQVIIGQWSNDVQDMTKTGKGIIYCSSNYYYEGDIVDSKAKGKGKLVLPNKIIYEGQTQNNLAKGQGQLHFKQQQIILKGTWDNGLPVIDSKMQLNIKNHKSFITFLPNAQNTKQFVQKNTYQVKIQFQNDNIYVGQISKDNETYNISGKGKLTYVDGSYYQGDFLNGKMHGFGKYYWKKTGHWYEGQYKQNYRQGKGKYYYNESRFKQGKWTKGEYHKEVIQINDELK